MLNQYNMIFKWEKQESQNLEIEKRALEADRNLLWYVETPTCHAASYLFYDTFRKKLIYAWGTVYW